MSKPTTNVLSAGLQSKRGDQIELDLLNDGALGVGEIVVTYFRNSTDA